MQSHKRKPWTLSNSWSCKGCHEESSREAYTVRANAWDRVGITELLPSWLRLLRFQFLRQTQSETLDEKLLGCVWTNTVSHSHVVCATHYQSLCSHSGQTDWLTAVIMPVFENLYFS